MKLYVCKRMKEWWSGALLIYAEDEEEARNIFKREDYISEPYSVEEVELKKGVIYNDESR